MAVVGVPSDSGTSYRPGARFGPAAVRQGSRLLRPWHTALDVAPLAGMCLVGADVVEVAPAYDHAEMTTVAAAHVAYELLALMLLGR